MNLTTELAKCIGMYWGMLSLLFVYSLLRGPETPKQMKLRVAEYQLRETRKKL